METGEFHLLLSPILEILSTCSKVFTVWQMHTLVGNGVLPGGLGAERGVGTGGRALLREEKGVGVVEVGRPLFSAARIGGTGDLRTSRDG